MKIIVERDAFADAVAAALRAIGKGINVPILNNVLLRPNGSAVGIVANNLDASLSTSIASEISGSDGGAITIPADALFGVVSRLPKGAQVQIEWNDSAHGAVLTNGRSRYRFNTLPASDFPELPEPQSPVTFTLPGKDLAEALNTVRFAIASEKTRFYLCGVYMHITDDGNPSFGGNENRKRLVFAATTSRELARVGIDVPAGVDDMPGVILPAHAVGELIKIASGVAGDVQIAVSPRLVKVVAGDVTFTTKLIDATYPDYPRVVATDASGTMVVDCDVLGEALQRLLVIGEGNKLRVHIAQGEMKLSIHSPETGDAEETIEVEWTGEPLAIGMSAGGILSVLDSMKADTCRILFDSSTKRPTILHALRNGEPEYPRTFLTMPMEV